ncbi:MAG: DNA polymerase Y family protein, partial [Rhizobiales bacterium]|nr:DNA polymerase Y family protein [Hyphomicrobiales bacterium]
AGPPEDAPLAVVAKVKSALRIVALDEAAGRRGLSRGQPLADARAMVPDLDVADEDAEADQTLLEAVGDWAERYTPLVALAGLSGLMLDITGSAHLFGGEAALLADLVHRLEAQGFFVRVAIADTPGAAAAARYAGNRVVPPGGSAAVLAPLPLATLRIDGGMAAMLDRVGLKRIGQILDAPRGPLAERFGRDLLHRLDQALGLEEEAITPRRRLPTLMAERRFAEPITREEDIAATLASLVEALSGKLAERGEGARILALSLFRVDGVVSCTEVGTSRPVRAPHLVGELFREKFAGLGEEIDAGFGFDMVRLSIHATSAFEPAQVDLTGEAFGTADLGQLVDRIGARLGPARVSRLDPADSHLPERAARMAPFADWPSLPPAPAVTGTFGDILERPLRLLAEPEPVEAVAEVPDGPPAAFRWRQATYRSPG